MTDGASRHGRRPGVALTFLAPRSKSRNGCQFSRRSRFGDACFTQTLMTPTLRTAIDVCRWSTRCALRSLFLAVALVAYGSVPSTALVQTEVESEIHEEATSSSNSVAELRRGLRYASSRQPVRSGAVEAHASCSPALAALYINSTPHLSGGLAVPLRC